ncbi:hypothetical protein PR048_030021 [Dryococelus australis]|uniref:Uncharacterized protein n=1 Tax=Dryococelus australis TaxID=614101 RepID=A0ABQ9G7S5_9NEOP|nr:hypothetical protein PR048_030021 [Dryococelus australis]
MPTADSCQTNPLRNSTTITITISSSLLRLNRVRRKTRTLFNLSLLSLPPASQRVGLAALEQLGVRQPGQRLCAEATSFALITSPEAVVAERLVCSSPTKANRVQSPAGSHQIFASGNRAGRFRWSAGFLGDLPFPPPLHSGAAPLTPRLALFGSQGLRCLERPLPLHSSLYFQYQLSFHEMSNSPACKSHPSLDRCSQSQTFHPLHTPLLARRVSLKVTNPMHSSIPGSEHQGKRAYEAKNPTKWDKSHHPATLLCKYPIVLQSRVSNQTSTKLFARVEIRERKAPDLSAALVSTRPCFNKENERGPGRCQWERSCAAIVSSLLNGLVRRSNAGFTLVRQRSKELMRKELSHHIAYRGRLLSHPSDVGGAGGHCKAFKGSWASASWGKKRSKPRKCGVSAYRAHTYTHTHAQLRRREFLIDCTAPTTGLEVGRPLGIVPDDTCEFSHGSSAAVLFRRRSACSLCCHSLGTLSDLEPEVPGFATRYFQGEFSPQETFYISKCKFDIKSKVECLRGAASNEGKTLSQESKPKRTNSKRFQPMASDVDVSSFQPARSKEMPFGKLSMMHGTSHHETT